LIVANVLASLSILVIALLFFMDALMLRQLHVALSISSIANAFTSPSLQSSTPLLVPKERLNQASGLSQLIRAVETILAPGPAGFVAGSFGLGAIFVIGFATFGANIIALRFPRGHRDPSVRPALRR
jgi:DHA3 family macrolide efflux protein-like MFS transporter